MAYSLGIDLGTTYSAAATARDGRIEIFQLGERAATIPSIVVLRADGEVLVGDAAERRSLGEPTRTAREFKRRLGDPTPIILGGTPYGAESLLAHLLKAIVAKVSEQSGGPPDAIVLTHPASYGAYKIDLLEQAVRQADVANVTLLTEPEAAAVHYAQQERVPAGAVIAVYDFGGGTFDATILRKTETGFEQLGRPEGMERLGGIDFDEALFTSVMAQVRVAGVTVDPNDPATLAAIARLREECRRAKEALSSDTDTTIQVVLPGLQTEMRLTREEFEEMIRPRITETVGALGRAAKSAGFGFDGVDRVLLVGGSSRIPLVAEMVREATGRPIAVDAHPKHSMALGAAFVAEQRRLASSTGAGATVAGVAVAGVAVAGTGTIQSLEAATAKDAAGGADAGGAGGDDGGTAVAGAGGAAIGAAAVGAAAAGAAAAGAAAAGAAAATGDAGGGAGGEVPPGGPDGTGGSGGPGGPDGPSGSGGSAETGVFPPTEVAPVVIAPGPAVATAGGGGADRRRMIAAAAAVGGVVLVLVLGIGASGMLTGGAASSSPPASVAVVSSAPSVVPSVAPTPSPTPVPTATPVPTPTAVPTPTPTPAGRAARITGITVSGSRYVVDYQVFGYTPALPGRHVHFFFDTVSVANAGVPGKGPWFLYAGPEPFTGYKLSDKPGAAKQMCVLVANSNHSIVENSGNCMDLP